MRKAHLLDRQKWLLKVLTTPWTGLSLLGFIVLLLYFPSLSNWGSVDDLTHLNAALQHEAPFKTFFRPLERWVNEFNVDWLGYEDLRFSLALNLIGFLMTIGATYMLGKALFPSLRFVGVFAAAIVALSSLSTTTVIQIDAISQQFATIFPLLFFLTLLQATQRRSRGLFFTAFSFAVLALLSKETSLGILVASPFAVFLINLPLNDRAGRQKFLNMFANYTVLVVVVLVYLGLRTALGYTFGGETSQYTLAFSLTRLAKNALLYFSGLAYLGGSTLDLFPTLNWDRMIASGIMSALLFVVSLLGIFRLLSALEKGRMPLLALFLLTLAGSIPVIVTEQVSELYVYSSLPYFALFIGFCFLYGCRQLTTWLAGSGVFIGAAVFSCSLFVWLTLGSYGKLVAHNYVSDQSLHYFTQARTFVENTPPKNLNLCWADATSGRIPSYSVFVRPPRLLASRALSFAIKLHQRQDSTSHIVTLSMTPKTHSCDYEMSLNTAGLQFEASSSPAKP